jgi:hypothetical protein
MGLRPTHGNESRTFVTPAQAGVQLSELDSRFRGNDPILDGVIMGCRSPEEMKISGIPPVGARHGVPVQMIGVG